MQAQDRGQTKQLVALPPRKRGAYATKFKNTEIISNHFEATLKDISLIVISAVKVTPSIPADHKQLRQEIINEIRGKIDASLQPVFRGFCMFTRKTLPQVYNLPAKGGSYTVNISQRKVFEVASQPNVFLLFLNNSLRGIMSRLGYVQIGRTGKYFTTANAKPIDNLKMYKGFTSNFVECDRGMFLRVDSARKIVRSQTVLDQINNIYKKYKDVDKEEKRNQVKKALINSIIMTNYGKCTFYRVLDIEFKSMHEVRIGDDFPSLKDYYQKRYGIEIKNQGQPLITAENKIRRRQVTGSDKDTGPTYLIPQLCLMTGIPDDFDENRRKSISQATILPPSDKYRQIQSFIKQLESTNEIKTLGDIGIKLNNKMNKFQTKQITPPSLELGSNNFVLKGKEAFFSLFDKPVFSGKHGINLAVVYQKGIDIGDMINTFTNTSKKLKVDFKVDKLELNSGSRDKDFILGIERALKTYSECNILMVVIPQNIKTAYPRLKLATYGHDRQIPLVTQFVTQFTLRKKSGAQSVHTKLLLQMIAKRGNILWVPSYQEEMNNVLDRTMIVGIDSCSKGGCNMMAACGTINSTFSLMASATRPLESIEKKYQTMLGVAGDVVKGYAHRNKGPPKELIIFMNGSPGDQINMIQSHFCQPLIEQIRSQYNAEVDLTAVMVNLRNSERFFCTPSGSQIKNVFPGTLVNSCVVSKNYDFFIVSQQSTKGCIVPNHYKVIHTTSKLEEGHLQELIFSQCFNYANWSGSIKIPAILQYAKKCAKFNAEVLSGTPVAESLATRPYYI